VGKIFLQQYRPICGMAGWPLHVCYVGDSVAKLSLRRRTKRDSLD